MTTLNAIRACRMICRLVLLAVVAALAFGLGWHLTGLFLGGSRCFSF